MFISPDERIVLLDLPPPAAADPALVAVFIGAAPLLAEPNAAAEALDYAARLGFVPANPDALTGLPLKFDSAAAFAAAFPDDPSWLAAAVSDYFNAGGRRAVVIRLQIDPSSSQLDAYVAPTLKPSPLPFGHVPLVGLDIAMAVPQAGLVLLPDLEQLCFKAAKVSLAQAPQPTLPPPQFRPFAPRPAPPSPSPASQAGKDDEPVAPGDVLGRVNAALAAQRPDMQCLFSIPIGADETLSAARLAARAKTYLYGADLLGPALPQIQALAPMLGGAGGAASPSGSVAGMIAGMAETAGIWRSLYGWALPPGSIPLRSIENRALADLRQWGVTALRAGSQGAVIDGDFMAIPRAATGQRSAGNHRLMGWLTRQLLAFGEQLVFDDNHRDGRVELILLDFFDDLHKAGALAGNQVSDAVTITSASTAANAIGYNIQIQTALALETIRLQFSPSRVTAAWGGGV
jgi:hypothetical protein